MGVSAFPKEMINKVLEFSPKSTFANFQLARIYLAEGDFAAAKVAFELESIGLMPIGTHLCYTSVYEAD